MIGCFMAFETTGGTVGVGRATTAAVVLASISVLVSDFFRFALLVFQLTFPTFIMGWVVALVQRGAASMQRID